MKRIGLIALSIGFGLLALAVPAAGAKSAETPFDLPNGTHVKVDICHNVDHNPHIVPVSINSADYPFDTGHGDLTLNGSLGFVSFVAHTGTGGHEHDFVTRVYTKHGNTETNTYVSEKECGTEVEVTTTTTQPPTTTTTEPPVVTTTTQPPVVTTTTEPPVVTTTTQPPVTVVTEPPAPAAPAAPVAVAPVAPVVVAPTSAPLPTELPHTGAASTLLAIVGALAGLAGLTLLLTSAVLKRAKVQ